MPEQIWREPPEETEDYPRLWVHDGRQSGAITFGRSRLPVSAVIGDVVLHRWEAASDFDPGAYGWDAQTFTRFLYDLFEVRGEFARLLCTLADVERDQAERTDAKFARYRHDGLIETSPWKEEDISADPPILHPPAPWWEWEPSRARVLAQLRRCIDCLEPPDEGRG